MALRTWFSRGTQLVRLMIGLGDLEGFFLHDIGVYNIYGVV